jgi:hypothetical protein
MLCAIAAPPPLAEAQPRTLRENEAVRQLRYIRCLQTVSAHRADTRIVRDCIEHDPVVLASDGNTTTTAPSPNSQARVGSSKNAVNSLPSKSTITFALSDTNARAASADNTRRGLHLIVNNARFLILPWIHCKNLASRILALISRRQPADRHARYAYRPVLLEAFVEKPRFTGTCYKAANWQNLGDTQGRGKLDTLHRNAQPIKSIWIYPLARNFQRHLCNG